MSSINTVVLTGNLTAKPETRAVGEAKVAKFTVAVNDKKDAVSFIDVECWRAQADFAEKYLNKGDSVGVVGNLRQDTWEKDGKKYSRIVVSANQVNGLGSRGTKDPNLDTSFTPSMIPF